jgi:hypothetical protein
MSALAAGMHLSRVAMPRLCVFAFLAAAPAFCQDSANRVGPDIAQTKPPAPADKRIFWIIPNYRTFPSLKDYKPLTVKAKFKIATQDSFDRGTVALAAAFAGQGQLTNSNPSFGQGMKGYAHYFATAFADFAVGNYMTEAIYPTLLHQDPRYFRSGTGSGRSRLAHAVKQVFWTHRDSGGTQFNFSEIGGNSTAAAISMAYYPDNRNASNAASKLGIQVGLDMAGNIMKEFWPDLKKKLSHKGRPSNNQNGTQTGDH